MAITDYYSPLTQASAGMPSPLQSFAQGQQVGGTLQQASRDTTLFNQQQADRQKAIEAATQKAIADAKAAAEIQADLDAAAAAGSTDAIEALMVKRPQLAENLKKAHAAKSETMKAETNRIYGSALAATQNGEPLVAVDFLNRSAAALKEKNPQEAQALERLAGMIDANPEKGAFILETYLTVNGGKDLIEGIQTNKQGAAALQAKQAEADEATAKAKVVSETALDAALAKINLDEAQAQRFKDQTLAEAKRLGFDYYKLAQETALARAALAKTDEKKSPQQEKEINDSVRNGVAANLSAQAAEELAAKFREAGKTPTFSGVSGKAVEAINRATGFTNELSAIRKQFNAVANKQVLQDLPPGAASDRDVALMREGIPEGTDDPNRVAEYLEAQARVTRAVQKIRATEAEYINQNGSLGPAKKDLVVDGQLIPARMTFEQVITAQSIKPAGKKTDEEAAAFGGTPVP